jgi:hypothetical protein
MRVVPTPNTRADSLAASGLLPSTVTPLGRRSRANPWDRSVALQQLAQLDDSASDPAIAARFGEAFAWRSGRALERRLEALALLEASGAFSEPLYRVIFRNVGAVTRDPTVMLLHAPGWEFFCGGVERTLGSSRALGEGRAARSHWSAEPGAGLMEVALDHAQSVVVFLTRELLANPRFVRELLLSVARVSKGTDASALIPRLQVVFFDDLPDLRTIDRAQWRAAFEELGRELQDPAIGRLGAALRSVPVVAAAGSPPGEVARSILRSFGR